MNHSPIVPSWRLDRSVNVGDLLVFLSLFFAGLGYVIHQDQRSTRSEDSIVTLKETDGRHDQAIKELKGDLSTKMDRLEAKIDRLVERRP